ncbi:hypothetical protein MNB_SUP05-12-61 [hydrothermal vent metagenome]|uniref:Uncharacterized protein n=1 Tax=hydrothermal vent metagenome TaxID=652676 RepID=A0A1W1DNS5_9ZZZZ
MVDFKEDKTRSVSSSTALLVKVMAMTFSGSEQVDKSFK